MKKVLILTATAGNGHNSCAYAMKEKLESEGNVEVRVVDILKEFSNALNVYTIDKGYSFLAANMLPVFNLFFKMFQLEKPENRYICSTQGIVFSTLPKLLKYIHDFQPDVVYSTQYFGAIAVTNLKLAYNLPFVSFFAVMDYVKLPFHQAAVGVDYLSIPNSDFLEEFKGEGFSDKQLLCTGIPVNEKFFLQKSRKQCAKDLGLRDDLFTIMILFGGGQWAGGTKIFKDVVRAVSTRNVQIIMINGRDEKGVQKVEKMKEFIPKNITVANVGFTKKLDEYMTASDMIVTKLGGTGLTEIINKTLPFVATENLPQQEKSNLLYFKSKGIGKSFTDKYELKSHIDFYIDNPEELEAERQRLSAFRTNGISEMAKLILSSQHAVYDLEEISNTNYKHVVSKVRKAMWKHFFIDKRNAHQNRKCIKVHENAAKIFRKYKKKAMRK